MRVRSPLSLVVAVLAIAVAVNSVFVWIALTRGAHESEQRRDDTCTAQERRHAQDIKGLRSTYLYLQTLPLSAVTDRHSPTYTLNRIILQGLPDTEGRARVKPPAFCAAPGVGIDQAEQRVPARPAHVNDLLRQLR